MDKIKLPYDLVLASKSPRRKYLLEEAGFEFRIIDIDVEESYPHTLAPQEVASFLAEKKCKEAVQHIGSHEVVLASDTIVVLNQRILEKPQSRAEAIQMLVDLSSNTHRVYTGVSIQSKDQKVQFQVASDVFIGEMEMSEIEYYVDQFKPFDKAGSYGIQEWLGWCKIQRIEGSYSNIMGLPMFEVYHKLIHFPF